MLFITTRLVTVIKAAVPIPTRKWRDQNLTLRRPCRGTLLMQALSLSSEAAIAPLPAPIAAVPKPAVVVAAYEALLCLTPECIR